MLRIAPRETPMRSLSCVEICETMASVSFVRRGVVAGVLVTWVGPLAMAGWCAAMGLAAKRFAAARFVAYVFAGSYRDDIPKARSPES